MGFADDGALCFRGCDPETLVDIAQPKIDKAVEWGAQNGLTFSVDKTIVVFFSRQHKFHNEFLPRLKKLKLTLLMGLTYLGIVLDLKLAWTSHIVKRCLDPTSFYIWSNLQSTIFMVLTLKGCSGSTNRSSCLDWHMGVMFGITP